MSEIANQEQALSAENPWPGPRSFSFADRAYFRGRAEDTERLAQLVHRAPAVVLYGQSGTGKSSLLEAGLSAALRQKQYLPILAPIHYGKGARPVGEQLLARIAAAMSEHGLQGLPPQPGESLWEFAHRSPFEFRAPDGNDLTPVLIIDQFEEAFTLGSRADTTATDAQLKQELAALLEHAVPLEVQQKLDALPVDGGPQFNLRVSAVKVVIGIRFDYMPDLLPWAGRIPALLRHQYRLEQLTQDQAQDIVLGPGGSLVTPEVADLIVQKVCQTQRSGDDEVSSDDRVEPFLLCLTCYKLNKVRQAATQAAITPELVSAESDKILYEFYDEAFKGLAPEHKPDHVRAWVEDNLVTPGGRRQPLAEDVVTHRTRGIPADAVTHLVKHRLLRRVDREYGHWYEFMHDRLTVPAVASRQAREQRTQMANYSQQERELAAKLRQQLASPTAEGFALMKDSSAVLDASLGAQTSNIDLLAGHAVCLSLAAELMQEYGEFDNAAKRAHQALDVYDRWAAVAKSSGGSTSADAPFSFARAQSLYVLGQVSMSTSSLVEAELLLKQAIEEANRVTDILYAAQAARVDALSRLGLGDIAYLRCLSNVADESYKHVLQIAEGAGKSARDEYDYWKAMALLGLAQNTSSSQIRIIEGYLKAVDELVEAHLDEDRRSLRWLRMKTELDGYFGYYAGDSGRGDQARLDYQRSVDVARQLVKADPNHPGYADRLAAALRGLGSTRSGVNDLDEIEKSLTAAAAESGEMVRRWPQWVQGHQSVELVVWAQAELMERRYVSAEAADRKPEHLTKAIELYERCRTLTVELASSVSDRYRWVRGQALCVGSIGKLRWHAGEFAEAEKMFREAIAICEKIPGASRLSHTVCEVVAYYYNMLGDLLDRGLKDPVRAMEALEQAVTSYTQVYEAARRPEAWLPFLLDLHIRSGKAREKAGDLDAATVYFSKAIGLVNQALAPAPGDPPPATPERAAERTQHELLTIRKRAELCSYLVQIRRSTGDPELAADSLCDQIEDYLRLWARGERNPEEKDLHKLRDEAKALAKKLKAAVPADTTDTTMSARVLRLEACAAGIAQATRLLPETKVVDRIRVPDSPEDWSSGPVVAGPWRTLLADQQQEELARPFTETPELLKIGKVLRMRVLPLACYNQTEMYEAEVESSDGRIWIVTYLRRGDETTHLTGVSPPIHTFNSRNPPRINRPDLLINYLQVFVNTLQGDEGCFRLVNGVQDLCWCPETPQELRQLVARCMTPLIVTTCSEARGMARATMQYSDALFYAELTVDRGGMVTMNSDEPIASVLPIRNEFFQLGARTLPPATAARAARNLADRQKDWAKAVEHAAEWARALAASDGQFSDSATAQAFHDLALYQLANDNAASALETAESRDSATAVILAAKAHALLYLGRTAEAEAAYKDGAERKFPRGVDWGAIVRGDWKLLSERGKEHPDFKKMRALLKDEDESKS